MPDPVHVVLWPCISSAIITMADNLKLSACIKFCVKLARCATEILEMLLLALEEHYLGTTLVFKNGTSFSRLVDSLFKYSWSITRKYGKNSLTHPTRAVPNNPSFLSRGWNLLNSLGWDPHGTLEHAQCCCCEVRLLSLDTDQKQWCFDMAHKKFCKMANDDQTFTSSIIIGDDVLVSMLCPGWEKSTAVTMKEPTVTKVISYCSTAWQKECS